MADERDRWLDEAAVDRLLRGEPVEPVGPDADPAARARAARLRAALDALAEQPAAGAELPGEAAALAAFRAARGPAVRAADPPRPAPRADPLLDLGHPVCLSAPAPRGRRAARPVRFGLAAALAAVAVGGVAAAVGAGLLDQNRSDTAGPGPATSVSADGELLPSGSQEPTTGPDLMPSPLRDGTASPQPSGGTQSPGAGGGRTLPGPHATGGGSAGASATDGPGKDAQGGLTGGADRDGKGADGGGDGTDPDREGLTAGDPGKDRGGEGDSRLRNVDLCREYRAGRLDGDRRDRLAKVASGAARIARFCDTLLDRPPKGGARGDAPAPQGPVSGGAAPPAPTLDPARPLTGFLDRR
ncbi:hypothetical protein [Streptomyces sp. cmx-4-9]|uniref:hypothetical protein n=1 Tax=Streptomyces sp. cmx-4-9 TaxID=2790941 RepID=UPI0039806DF4